MTDQTHNADRELSKALSKALAGAPTISGLERLSGGASQETWRFDATDTGGAMQRLILRRSPGGRARAASSTGLSLETEAHVIEVARAHGVPAPRIVKVFESRDEIGPAYAMERIEGETIPRKILRDQAFAAARPQLARQCGEILARIHAVPAKPVSGLTHLTARAQFHQYRDLYDSYDHPHPVFEFAFKWLEGRLPPDGAPHLVHGDFRHGNLLIGPNGVNAVLDWELAHLGDPAEDLGWICVNSWRFGVREKIVGGFGDMADLLEGYAAASGQGMTAERVHFWQVFGSLKWGIMCMTMYQAFKTGLDPSVERAAIGRRASEAEIDLINLIAGHRIQ